jgi:PKD repeat protein
MVMMYGVVVPNVFAVTEKYRLVWNANDDPATTMTVGWNQVTGTDPAVYYGTDPDGTGWIAQAPQDSNTWAGMNNTFAILTDLLPDTAYYFEVRDSEGSSETMWFKTAPDAPQEFTFIAGGDSRSNTDPRTWGNILVSKIRPLFIAHGGDYMNDGTPGEWFQWLDEWQLIKSEDGRMYPIVPAHGNHENADRLMVHYIFNTPEDCYYAVNVADNMMRLWVLNTELQPGVGYDAFEDQTPLKWNEQAQWLADDMAANTDFIWKLTNYHRPLRPHQSGKSEGIGRIQAWAQTFYDNGMDLAIECDSHLVKYTYPLAPSDGLNSYESFSRDDLNGTMFIGEGSWGAPTRPNDDDKPWTMASDYFWQFKLIHASPDNLDIRTVKFEDGASVNAVIPLTQEEQDANPFALPQNLDLWQPLPGEVITLHATGNLFQGADIDNAQYVGKNSDWRYLDDGSDQDTEWADPVFDDSGWAEGQSQFGFGDGDEETVIESGHITYYFRKNFMVQDTSRVIELTMRMLRDDGAIVYVNGIEVTRSNMPEGTIDHTTLAEETISGDDEIEYITLSLAPEVLTTGTNLIAVEVHQDDISSHDLSFDLDFTGLVSNVSGPAPAAPTGLSASIVGKDIQLAWDDNANDEMGYKILRKEGSGAWDVLEARLPADTTTYTNMGLETGEAYIYRIQAYSQYGLSGSSNEVTEAAPQQLAQNQLYSEDFQSGSMGDLSVVSVTSNHDWRIYDYYGSIFVQCNGYGADEPSDDWLITPPFNLIPYSSATINCELAWKYGGPEIMMKVSNDYDPNVHINPNDATWHELELPPPNDGNYVFYPTGDLDLTPYRAENVYVAWHYISTGTESEDGRIWEVDNIAVSGEYNPPAIELEDFDSQTLGDWMAYSRASNANWHAENVEDHDAAACGGVDGDAASDDWLISPPLTISVEDYAELSFDYYYSGSGPLLEVQISTDYTGSGDPLANGTWNTIAVDLSGDAETWHESGYLNISTYTGSQVYVALRYLSSGSSAIDGRKWGVDNVKVNEGFLYRLNANFTAGVVNYTTIEPVSFNPLVSGGMPPFSYEWDFGDGSPVVTEENPSFIYTTPGTYTVSLTVTDGAGRQVLATKENYLTIIEATTEGIPAMRADIRVATFNAFLNRTEPNQLLVNLSTPDDPQVRKVAEIIQRINPDVILLNEFDYVENNAAVDFLKSNYLEVSQNGAPPIYFDYVFNAESNTGIPSGYDFNNDGQIGGPDDCYGFGEFPGQYGMVLFSKYPILQDQVRTFQKFLWKDMPGGLLPFYNTGESWYSDEELEVFRLSSKSHWDVPVNVNGEVIHILCSHPTPPVFDGDEDRNGKRNHDEIRLWADYTAYDQSDGDYIYDDNGTFGGIGDNQRFVIIGDENADPGRGDSYDEAIFQLLDSGTVDSTFTPTSEGAREQGTAEQDTASWGLRADYVLPSEYGFVIDDGAVFWPTTTDILYHLVENDASSDHRLVWADLYLLSGSCETDADCADDGNYCNGNEYCVLTGGFRDRNMCRSGGNYPCGENEVCDEESDLCFECLTGNDCTPGELCENNICIPNVECIGDEDCDEGEECINGTCMKLKTSTGCTTDEDCDDGIFCNGAERCVEGTCVSRNADPCDDGVFCNGFEACDEENDVCRYGQNPCLPHLTGLVCDEPTDLCVPPKQPAPDPPVLPSFAINPDTLKQSRWLIMPVFINIEGSETHFDESSEVTINPAKGLFAFLPKVRDAENISLFLWLMPRWMTGEMNTIEITITTGSEVVKKSCDVELLFPSMLEEE